MYSFNGTDFTVEDYNNAKTFANFLPGIAGLTGTPMWVFYANKGQGVCSFGVRDKNHCIIEFYPANQSYQQVFNKGFRTYIKANGTVFEPFSPHTKNEKAKMKVNACGFSIESVNSEHGIKVTVDYFTVPMESFAALVRRVKITNVSDKAVDLEVLDGLPEIFANGVTVDGYKFMGNTYQAWSDVFNLENKIPFYHVRASVDDSAEVSEITDGYFYLSSVGGELTAPIVDRKLIFGEDTSFYVPHLFCKQPLSEILKQQPVTENKYGCGFTPAAAKLASGQTLKIDSLIGYTKNIDQINADSARLCSEAFFEEKEKINRDLIEDLTKEVKTKTASPVFDKYIQTTYMDNLLRGGKPMIFGKNVYHVFSRKHGDMERDYNFFVVEPEYYSQGNGNFRDVNQNRRMDVSFCPQVMDFNIKMFMDLIGLDGYNPLCIEGRRFTIDKDTALAILHKHAQDEQLINLFSSEFTPGQIAQRTDNKDFLYDILAASSSDTTAELADGYWSDHFTYNMDLIDNYLSVWPDKKHELLFERKDYKFFETGAKVRPRSEKYVVTKNGVRQYNALDESNITNGWAKDKNGKLVQTNLYGKLLSLAVNKYALLDPYGMGIEMDGGKPGWNDSLNGLPGLIGSGLSETFETKRIFDFLLSLSDDETVDLPEEIAELMQELLQITNAGYNDFDFWNAISNAREAYRDKIYAGVSGVNAAVRTFDINDTLAAFSRKLGDGIDRALVVGNGVYPTYFYYTMTDYDVKDGVVIPKAFEQVVAPLYLESTTRALKVTNDKAMAKRLYDALKASDVYDRKLKMYKICESLKNASYELGRATAFTSGWLENESVFLHMEYKYFLQLLKSGLYDEYYTTIKDALVPFLDPAMYGRSILENSSFIASSANPDESVHGTGFVARLSGSTVEMLEMWAVMFAGKTPFTFENGVLTFALHPALPEWLFDEKDQAAFTLLGNINVIYHNPSRKNTYDGLTVQAMEITKQDGTKYTAGSALTGEDAVAVRNGDVKEIVVELG